MIVNHTVYQEKKHTHTHTITGASFSLAQKKNSDTEKFR